MPQQVISEFYTHSLRSNCCSSDTISKLNWRTGTPCFVFRPCFVFQPCFVSALETLLDGQLSLQTQLSWFWQSLQYRFDLSKICPVLVVKAIAEGGGVIVQGDLYQNEFCGDFLTPLFMKKFIKISLCGWPTKTLSKTKHFLWLQSKIRTKISTSLFLQLSADTGPGLF